MELPTRHHNYIIDMQEINLELIENLYSLKLSILRDFLNDVEKYKHKQNFDINEHYQNYYAKQFASIGGKVSGYVRCFKNELILELLLFMKYEYQKMDLFTLKMFQAYSKEVFDSSPTQKSLIKLLNNEIDLEQKLKEKKETFGHSHVSKMSFLNILGDGVNSEMKSIFKSYYGAFIEQRINLMEIFKNEEDEAKAILKAAKDEMENKKEE